MPLWLQKAISVFCFFSVQTIIPCLIGYVLVIMLRVGVVGGGMDEEVGQGIISETE